MRGRAQACAQRLARIVAITTAAALAATATPAPAFAAAAGAARSAGSGTSVAHALLGAPTLAARPPGIRRGAGTTTTRVTAPGPVRPAAPKQVGGAATSALRTAQATAAEKAKSAGHAVPIPELTTDHSTTVANPDGTFTATEAFSPQRTKVNGSWAPIDTTLVRTANGSWAPRAAVAKIALSPGGNTPLATVTVGTRTLTLTWPLGPLPAPRIQGDHATYPGLLPGVDLRVSADAEGVREVLVVADRQAAANPALTALTFGVTGTGLTVAQSGGGITAIDPTTHQAVFTSPPPSMWDSGSTGTTGAADPADAPGLGARTAPMPLRVAHGKAVISPNQALLRDRHAVWPMYLDPQVGMGTLHYAEVYSQPTLANSVHFDSSVSGSGNGAIVRAGYDSEAGGGYIRGMFSFNVGNTMFGQEGSLANPTGAGLPEDGSNITAAELKLTSNNNPCNNGANFALDVDAVNRMDPAYPPTWNQDGPNGGGHNNNGMYYAPVWKQPTVLYSANPSRCGGAGNTIDVQGQTLTDTVRNIWKNWSGHNGDAWCPGDTQADSCAGDGTATFGIKWTNEAAYATYGSWEVGASNVPAQLSITYVPAPVINQLPSVTPGNSGTPITSNCGQDSSVQGSGPGAYIPKNISNSLTLNAKFYDIDGGRPVQTQYEFTDVTSGGTSQYFPGPGSGNYYAVQGSAAGGQVAFPGQTLTEAGGQLQEGHTYKFYPRAVDTFDSSWLDSSIYGFSYSCRFTVAFNAPNTPTLRTGGANAAPDLPALGSGTAPVVQRFAGQPDAAGVTVQADTAGVAIDHFDYVVNGDSSKIPQNGPGCGSGTAGCLPTATSTPTGSGPAGFTATATVGIPAGVTTMGDNSLWVQAVDKAGNRSGVFHYQFYLPGNPNATPTLGDATGNGYPTIVVAAPDPADTSVEHLVAFPGNSDPDVTANVDNGVEVAPSTGAPDGTSWADTLITHRGAERGVPVDDLFAYSDTTHALYYYLNSAVFGSPVPKDAFTGGSPTGGAHRIVVTRPDCTPAPDNDNCVGYAPDWSNVTQILALGNAAGGAPGTFAGRTNLITVESDGNHGAHVWMFSPAAAGQLTDPVLLSYDVSQFNWADADLIAPGATTSSGLPDLWARDRKSGNLYQFTNKRNSAGTEDPTSLGNQSNATVLGHTGDYSASMYPVLVSAGNPTSTGAQTNPFPALWAVQPDGQLKLLPGSSTGPAANSAGQSAAWPTSAVNWTNSTGATSVNGGAVADGTGPILLGVDQSTGTNLCMDLANASPSPGNYVQGFTCNGTPAQLWTVSADGTIRWGAADSTACLTVSTNPAGAQHGLPSALGNTGANAGLWPNTPVVIGACPTAAAAVPGTQLWALRPSTANVNNNGTGHGWYTIYNPASGLDLDNYNCNSGGGVQLELYSPQDVTCQQWQAPPAQGTWLQALGAGLATQTKEPATATASVTTGQPTANGADYTLAATKAGDHYGVDWDVPYAGTYAVWSYLATGPGDGQVQVTVDAAGGNGPLPMVADTYAATAGWNTYTFGSVYLSAGMHTFTYTAVGKNSASNGYAIGLDTLLAGPDHDTGPHAALTVTGAGTQTVPVVAPAAVTLDATQSWPGAATLSSYAFDFGDGTTVPDGTATTAGHTYTAPGVYTASVTVTDQAGATATTSHLVHVTGAPTDLTADDGGTTAPCATDPTSAPTLASLTPNLGATVSSGLSAQFEVRDITDPSVVPPLVIGGTGSTGSAGPASTLTAPTLLNGHEYAFAARSSDGAGTVSLASAPCYFWALTSGGRAAATGAIGLPFDNTLLTTGSPQTWAGPLTTLAWGSDGDLALYRTSDNALLWAANVWGAGNVLALQNDGNAVIYSSTPTVTNTGSVLGTPVWSSGTPAPGVTSLLIATDGSVTVHQGAGVLWSAPLSAHYWTFGTGTGSSDADHGVPGGATENLTGGYAWNNGSVSLDGTSGYASGGNVLDTTKSYTVASWVKLTSTTQWATALSQDATTASGFFLQYSAADNRWAMSGATADTTNPGAVRALSTSPPSIGVWTHLTGVYDANAKTLTLYVNGQKNGTVGYTSAFAATGSFNVGRSRFNAVNTNFFPGSLAGVRVWQRVLSDSDVAALARGRDFVPPVTVSSFTDANLNKCLDDTNRSLTPGSPVGIYDCLGSTAQTWSLNGDGTITTGGMCLDIVSPGAPGTVNGTKVQLWTCNGGVNQQWVVQNDANGSIHLLNPYSGRCLDDPNSSTVNATQTEIWDCNNTNAQTWAPLSRTNLAAGTAATAASQTADWEATHLTDGVYRGTSATPGFASARQTGAASTVWAQVDLGSSQRISEIDLDPRDETPAYLGLCFPSAFTLQISVDGSAWTTVANLTGYPKPGDTPQRFAFNPAYARYVKLVATQLTPDNNGNYYLELRQIAVYGS
ncbi:ricin-type beta-trefoil lectin domain protein [Streptacidiphilus sp. N1-3]|uniref:Ricin-type beta-trefoil lectin domain protein n=1 Tax=Streptacidiphilus alkalitolerans TaxID=3342712 RepID=A0ABV6X1R0_9ACTN